MSFRTGPTVAVGGFQTLDHRCSRESVETPRREASVGLDQLQCALVVVKKEVLTPKPPELSMIPSGNFIENYEHGRKKYELSTVPIFTIVYPLVTH